MQSLAYCKMRTEVIFLPFSDFVKCTDRLSHLLTFTLDLHATLSVSSVLVNINHKHSIPSYSLSSFCLCLSVCLRQLTEKPIAVSDCQCYLNNCKESLFELLFSFQLQLMALLTHTAQILQQMSILLKCCPSEKVSLLEWSPLPQSMLSPLAMSSADDVLVAEITQTLKV